MGDFVCETLEVNPAGHLSVGGCDCLDLAREFGTPLYVMDEMAVRANCRAFRQAVETCYGAGGKVIYASKALCTKAILSIMHQEGIGVDVVSGGELATALAAGVPADTLMYHGNFKTLAEIRQGLAAGVGRFVVDNRLELDQLSGLCEETGRKADVLFRVKPGIDAHTHDYVLTGQIDSKFGVALENGEALDILRDAWDRPGIRVRGIHCHIGSQIFEVEPFVQTVRVMLGLMDEFRQATGKVLEELNLGGGFGIRYVDEHRPLPPARFMEACAAEIRRFCSERDFPMPFVAIEPGRAMVAAAGITLYTVGSVKTIPGIRTYVAVDGGMFENPRYALYGSPYDAVLAAAPLAERVRPVTIAGKCCESGDLIQEHLPMPGVRPGDIMAVMATGAYNYSMAGNYNRNPRPAMVLCREGRARVIVRRETYENLLERDEIPDDLAP